MDSNDDEARRAELRQRMAPLKREQTLTSRIGRHMPEERLIAGIITVLFIGAFFACFAYNVLNYAKSSNLISTTTNFCTALTEGDAASAYALLSDELRQKYTQDEFARMLQSANIASCGPDQSEPGTNYSQVIHSDNNATTAALTFTYKASGATENVILHLTNTNFVSWRVSGLDSTALPLSA